ncbi:MAG TPA: carboxypeptidase regulatory-like domain-containing protein [Xenococcaceae cyanobacterium]
MKNWQILLLLGLNSVAVEPVLAHGARIEYGQAAAIVIKATYDDGTPMAQAQAVVYSPDEPTKPWLKGMTDNQGQFSFVPDATVSGNWDVKVRQSGHGDIVSIPVTEGAISSEAAPEAMTRVEMLSNRGDLTPLQKIMMAGIGIWGFIGTALFFSRNGSRNQQSTD